MIRIKFLWNGQNQVAVLGAGFAKGRLLQQENQEGQDEGKGYRKEQVAHPSRQADGCFKVYEVSEWVKDWQERDMIDDTEQYGLTINKQ